MSRCYVVHNRRERRGDDELQERAAKHPLLFKPLMEKNRLEIWSLLNEMLSAWIHRQEQMIFLNASSKTLGSAHLHGNISYTFSYSDPLEH